MERKVKKGKCTKEGKRGQYGKEGKKKKVWKGRYGK